MLLCICVLILSLKVGLMVQTCCCGVVVANADGLFRGKRSDAYCNGCVGVMLGVIAAMPACPWLCLQ